MHLHPLLAQPLDAVVALITTVKLQHARFALDGEQVAGVDPRDLVMRLRAMPSPVAARHAHARGEPLPRSGGRGSSATPDTDMDADGRSAGSGGRSSQGRVTDSPSSRGSRGRRVRRRRSMSVGSPGEGLRGEPSVFLSDSPTVRPSSRRSRAASVSSHSPAASRAGPSLARQVPPVSLGEAHSGPVVAEPTATTAAAGGFRFARPARVAGGAAAGAAARGLGASPSRPPFPDGSSSGRGVKRPRDTDARPGAAPGSPLSPVPATPAAAASGARVPPEQAVRRVRTVHAAMHVELLRWLRDSALVVNDAWRRATAVATAAQAEAEAEAGGGAGDVAPRLPRVSIMRAVHLAHRLLLLPVSAGQLASLYSFAVPAAMQHLQ